MGITRILGGDTESGWEDRSVDAGGKGHRARIHRALASWGAIWLDDATIIVVAPPLCGSTAQRLASRVSRAS